MVGRVGWPCKEVVGLEEDSEVVVVAFSMSSGMYETGCFFFLIWLGSEVG